MKEQGSVAERFNAPDLKSDVSGYPGTVGSNPTATELFRHKRHKQYLNTQSANATRAWSRISSKLTRPAGSIITPKTKPQDNRLGLCRIYNKFSKKEKNTVSPVVLSPQKDHSTSHAVSPKISFEQALESAFALKEQARQETAKVMAIIDFMLMDLQEAK